MGESVVSVFFYIGVGSCILVFVIIGVFLLGDVFYKVSRYKRADFRHDAASAKMGKDN